MSERTAYPGYWAEKDPTRLAYEMAGSGERVTYQDLEERSNQVAHLLRAAGVASGDTIAILLDNHRRYLEIAWGAQRAGVCYTPINWHLTGGEIEYIVNDCGAKLVVASAKLGPQVAALEGKTPNVRARFSVDGAIDGFERFEDAADSQPKTPIADEKEGADMIYSSGTTGRPKGGRQVISGLPVGGEGAAPLVAFLELFGFDDSTTYLSPGAPLYHAAPLRFLMLDTRMGCSNVILERFDPVEAIRRIERNRVTHSQWVPTMFVRLLRLAEEERRGFDLSSHRMAIHAAAPCPVPVKEQMIEWWGPIITEYYGGSEGGGITLVDTPQWLAHRGSVGRSVMGSIHIVGEDGEELPPGEAGIIYFEGGRAIDYHNDPEKTRKAHHPKGWGTLGDVGYLDEEGYLYLTDRKDFMIISGGVNLYPQETEDVLIMHPKVADVAVIGVPNEEYGEEVKAVVQPIDMADAGDALAGELIAFCADKLSKQKIPRSVDFERELPRSPAGKLYKRRIREKYWKGHGTRIV